jgi:hypothetical protein
VLGYDLGQQALVQERREFEAVLQSFLQVPEYLTLSRLATRSLSEREQSVFLEMTVRRFEALVLGLRLAPS